MKNNFYNDVDNDNLDIAGMILDDSKKINTDTAFNKELFNNIQNFKSKKKISFKKVSAFATAVAACIVVIVGIGFWNFNSMNAQNPKTSTVSSEVSKRSENDVVSKASDYSEIYDKMMAAVDVYSLMMYDSFSVAGEVKKSNAKDTAASESSVQSSTAGGTEFSETNLNFYDTNEQTANVHEGDIVKTDGKYIYTLTCNKKDEKIIVITEADGIKLNNISEIAIPSPSKKKSYQYISEIYVVEDKLIAIGTRFTEVSTSDNIITSFIGDCLGYSSAENPETIIYTYDISDRKKPELISENIQDGSYNSSRLSNGYLYTISNKKIIQLTKENCVPTINGKLMTCDCIYLPEQIDSQEYTVITTLNIDNSDNFSHSVAVAGGTSVIYASQENLYLISNIYTDKDITKTAFGKKTMQEHGYDISEKRKVKVDNEIKKNIAKYYDGLKAKDIVAYESTGVYENKNTINIVKYSYDGDEVKFVADTTVDGYSYDNMNFDEYKDFLRLVTTETSETSIETRISYYDKDGNFLFYNNDYERTVKSSDETNNVFVLDKTLNKKAEIKDLAKGESIYSSRFLGDYGYFVTYENTDPLFSVDFSDMENPKIIGKLKIPGFSDYLHFYTEDKLFGFGMETDEKDGEWESLKLEMYNVADGNASQESKLILDGYDYSDASYNYKAIMVDARKELIGFSAASYSTGYNDNGKISYLLYTYKNRKFKKILEIDLENDYDIRGFYIGDYLYIVDPYDGIHVLNLKTYKKDKKVGFEKF